MRATLIYSLLLTSLLAIGGARSPIVLDSEGTEVDPKLVRTLLDNNFESGTLNPWYDESPGYVNWRVENLASPSEANSTAPKPDTGTKYVRAARNADLASGLAVLRSPIFTASAGDRVSFDFWIRSKRPEGNNLELVWVVDRTEQQLVSLSQYSTLSNYEWRTQSAVIPVNSPTEGALIFYGYCGSNFEDAIAIDNILVESSTYTTQAPGSDCTVLSASFGTFTSPNYPSSYPENANICWLITGAYSITLQFNNFETETGKDTLKIYLGTTTSSELFADLSGSYTPNAITKYTESMLLVFTSDSANSFTGFSITYQIVRPTTLPSSTTPSTKATSTYAPIICVSSTETDYLTTYPWGVTTGSPSEPSSCGGLISGYSGIIESPNYPNEYGNGLDCRYLVQVPCGYRVRLYFNSFNTESGYDFVNVHDGPSTSDYILLRTSGTTRPSTVYSSSNEILLRFTTDGSETRSGWQATFEYYY
ncbi:deleted in malignant brain tumors 1 protein-like [Daphnia carinata]|uniref:deleted in malignant brain tumors 1 protein-like n=1 Tax=Daphnia carinata TaxID=120202 RepID=UPI00257F6685|nr:deleted in malignant brain tumors 1 protein-like [Daphnia carinata]